MFSAFALYSMVFAAGGFPLPQLQTTSKGPNASGPSASQTTKCHWKCFVSDSEVGERMMALIEKNRLIPLDLNFNRHLDNWCINQSESLNLTKPAGIWLWSTTNELDSNENVTDPSDPERGKSTTWYSRSVEKFMKVNVSCSFEPSQNEIVQVTDTSIDDVIATVIVEKVMDAANGPETIQSTRAVLCYKEKELNSPCSCVNQITDKARDITGFTDLICYIWIMLLLFCPAVLCLFPPTKIPIDGEWMIVLEGPSHVSIRAFIANYFCSRKASPLYRTKMLLLFTVIILILSRLVKIANALVRIQFSAALNILNSIPILVLSIVFCLLWIIQTLLLWQSRHKTKLCRVCYFCLGQQISHEDEDLQALIKQHLRIQPLIFKKCFHLLREFAALYFQTCRSLLSYKAICLFVFFVLLIPLVLVLLCGICLVAITILVVYSSSMSTFCDWYIHPFKKTERIVLTFLGFSQFCWLGFQMSYFTLRFTIDLVASIRAFFLTFPEGLTTVALALLLIIYIARWYNSFTQECDNLAVMIYNHIEEFTCKEGDSHLKSKHSRRRVIPKDLYDEVFEKLKPFEVGFSVLLVKIVLLLTFASVMFLIITEVEWLSEKVKAYATFFTGIFPLFIEMVSSRGSGRTELEKKELTKSVKSIVVKYDEYLTYVKSVSARPGTGDVNVEDGDVNDNNNTREESETARLIGGDTSRDTNYGTLSNGRAEWLIRYQRKRTNYKTNYFV